MPERPDQHRRALVSIKVEGKPLSDAVLLALTEVRVDQSLHVPDTFTLRFNDHDLTILGGATFDLGAEVDIGIDSHGVVTSLMSGEVTSLSAELDGMHQQQFVVTGLDRRHRLSRGVKVRTFTKSKDNDVVSKIAQEYGLRVDADATSGQHEYLLQCGTDYEFIAERARYCGFHWWVSDRTLYFKKPEAKRATRTVTWGSGLRRFRLRLSSTESAKTATVRGWDPVSQQALVGTSAMAGASGGGVELATDAPLITKKVGKGASSFAAERFAWGTPVKDTHEANGLATALAQRATAEQAIAKGETLGDPDLRPGAAVKIEGLAESLCGTYQLTRVEHVLAAGQPYLTRFESGGAHDHGLVDLLGGGQRPSGGVSPPLLGSSLVVGIVTNNNDPDKLGRVKVKFPTLTDKEESDWARVVSTGAGSSRGLQIIPDVNDEVLVGFEHGDVTRPLVLGGL
ncbi:MAG TPA: VgrG-related protein, partial [Acidimicrobiia bacterium]